MFPLNSQVKGTILRKFYYLGLDEGPLLHAQKLLVPGWGWAQMVLRLRVWGKGLTKSKNHQMTRKNTNTGIEMRNLYFGVAFYWREIEMRNMDQFNLSSH